MSRCASPSPAALQRCRCGGGAGTAAPVAARSAPAAGRRILSPLSAHQAAHDLDFGTLVVTAAGTAVIDPEPMCITTTGGVVSLGGQSPHPATVRRQSRRSKNAIVHIRLPKTAITVTRVGGTETMTVDDLDPRRSSNRDNAVERDLRFRGRRDASRRRQPGRRHLCRTFTSPSNIPERGAQWFSLRLNFRQP